MKRRMLTLLELELFDTLFIWGDGRAFYADRIFFDGFGGIYSYLIVGLVAVWKSLEDKSVMLYERETMQAIRRTKS